MSQTLLLVVAANTSAQGTAACFSSHKSECVPVSDRIKRVINSSGRSLHFRIDECDQQTIQISMLIIKTLLGSGWHAEKLMQSNFSFIFEPYPVLMQANNISF